MDRDAKYWEARAFVGEVMLREVAQVNKKHGLAKAGEVILDFLSELDTLPNERLIAEAEAHKATA